MSIHETFKNKRVLVTGHTGFKGSWLSIWLKHFGADVYGLSNIVPTRPSNFELSEVSTFCTEFRHDIRELNSTVKTFEDCQPDYVFHLAAQALVRTSYDAPLGTISTNSIGTSNVLEAMRLLDKPITAIMITSDKVYDNVEWLWGYRENDRIGGKDPYSASKGMAELAIRTYYESYFKQRPDKVRVAIARAGNVIGGGDWADDRIVPDCMRAWSERKAVDIRNPNATRPWQHVFEPLSAYLILAAELYTSSELNGESFNFGPPANQNYSVGELISEMMNHWDNVRWNDVSQNEDRTYESGLLKLNCDKANQQLNWHPTLEFEDTIRMTTEWYKCCYQNNLKSMRDFSLKQLENYLDKASKQDIRWS